MQSTERFYGRNGHRTMIQKKNPASLTEGSIVRGLLGFAVPLFLGQLLQQLYNMADAWVVGNFAENEAFAAVSMASHISFLIIGFFNGIAIGGGVVISHDPRICHIVKLLQQLPQKQGNCKAQKSSHNRTFC